MKLEHEEITKRTRETITFLQKQLPSPEKPLAGAGKGGTRKTHTPMNRTCASRLCGEERDETK